MKDLNTYSKKALNLLSELNIKYSNKIEFKVSTRMTRSWGNCSKHSDGTYTIKISDILLQDTTSEDALMNTVIHEILHTVNGCLNHGPNWKAVADKVNRNTHYNIKRCTSCEEKGIDRNSRTRSKNSRPKKWAVKCCQCGNIYKYSRKPKWLPRISSYRCGRCNAGNLMAYRLDGKSLNA